MRLFFKSVTSSFSWNLFGLIIRNGTSFLINIVLARILGPEPYGLVAVATIFISIANMIIESGLRDSLIQKKEITNKDIQFVYSIQLILALIFCGIFIGLAPLIAKLYNQPAVTPVLRILSISLFFQAASQASTALLSRKMAFKQIQLAQIISYFFGYVGIGLPMAYLEYGVWSLVFAQLTQSFLYLCICYGSVRHPLGLVFRGTEGMLRFGGNMLGISIGSWMIMNYDNSAISYGYGATNLGLYNRAWNLAMTPVGIVVTSCSNVLFTASSILQESHERVRNALLGVFTLIGITLIPFSVCESLVATDLVQFVYGDKWHAAAPNLAILALAMPFFALMAVQGPVLAGLGKPQVEFKFQWFVVGFACISFLIAIKSSMQIIVWSVFVLYLFRFLLASFFNFRILRISFDNIKMILVTTLAFSGLTYLTVLFTSHLMVHLTYIPRLILQGTAGIIVWIFMFLFSWHRFLPEQFQKLISDNIPERFIIILNSISGTH